MKVNNPVRGFHPMVSKQRVENHTPESIRTIFATNESQPTASAMYTYAKEETLPQLNRRQSQWSRLRMHHTVLLRFSRTSLRLWKSVHQHESNVSVVGQICAWLMAQTQPHSTLSQWCHIKMSPPWKIRRAGRIFTGKLTARGDFSGGAIL